MNCHVYPKRQRPCRDLIARQWQPIKSTWQCSSNTNASPHAFCVMRAHVPHVGWPRVVQRKIVVTTALVARSDLEGKLENLIERAVSQSSNLTAAGCGWTGRAAMSAPFPFSLPVVPAPA